MRGTVVEVACWWAVLAGVTLVAVGSSSPVELAVAGAGAAGAALVAVRMRRAAGVRVRGTAGAPRALGLLPYTAARGCATLVRVLVRVLPRRGPGGGRVRRIRLREGADAGWAAMALGWSAGTCVLDVPEGTAEVVVHALDGGGAIERAVGRRSGDGR
ncbi:hypothetical protein ACGFYQ_12605 [Streptomyces sp. NPDC048258]|uniref:hypothetical protein n=1 Tax=Streptomyces sp. NPDC048258 TaxID=3365527 RepID=UPI00371D1AB2